MIIVRGTTFSIENMVKAEAVLFTFDGTYFYVESGIVGNELRVFGNWKTAATPPTGTQWVVLSSQGDQIPQELGDWLVAHQDNKQAPNKSE